jgi:hypothetical protein
VVTAARTIIAVTAAVADLLAVRRRHGGGPIGIGLIRWVWGGLRERMHRAVESMPAVRHTTHDVPWARG